MAGVPNIPVVSQVVDRTSEAAANAIFRGFRYLFCYKKLVDDLDAEINKVDIQAGEMFKKSEKEKANGKIIKDHVSGWQKDVDEFQERAKEFSEKYKNRSSWTCLKCLPIPNPASRFQLGREAVQKAKGATELLDSGKELMLHEIADLPPTENLPKQSDVAFQDFPSRKYAYGELWNALEAEGSSPVIGIYGMPGVGKTRMMEQLWKEAMEEEKFDKVVRANVGSEELNVIKLQDQIAADLDCNFDPQDNVNRRANLLKNSLMYWKKVLVIFDDVWTEIPIEYIIGDDFGKSSNSKGSKILLTSRREDVCLKNKCQRPIHITTLTDKEAWDLFQKTVGTDHIYDLQDDNLAKKVCTKCAGLPLLIRAVGKALEFMSPNHHVWKDALSKLEKGHFKNIAGIDPQVYACVKLSIDALQEDAKLCLFMCSLFPEDADIHIATLIQFAIGSQLILDGESAIPTMVDVLTKSSLLLECDEDHITRMHDLIRDVSRFEATESSKYAFLHVKSGGSRLTDNAGYSTPKLSPKLLRLDVAGDQFHFPKYLVATDLYTLWLHCDDHLRQFPGGFFDMFVNLGFLILQKVHSLPEHFSLEPLGELNMLIFDGCDIRKTDVRLFPKNLKTLCIWDCHLPSPLDLSTLNNLLRLDIQQEDLPEVVMVRNAISSLSRLEEMHIPNGIRFSDDANGVTPILDEISKLTCLRSLKISFRDFEPCQGTALFKKLSKYDISVPVQWRKNWEALPKSTKIIELIDVEVKGDEGIQSLLERAEKVTLRSTDVDVSSICKSNIEAFTDLKELSIESCHRVEYIARISQNGIWHGSQQRASFSKLTMLTIQDCTAMKYLFCKSVAKCLGQLQEMEVRNCDKMEAIVMDEGTSDGEIIDFSKLRRLRLEDLKSLRSFYRKNKEMHWGSTDNSVILFPPLFDEMVAFPSLEDLTIYYLENTCIWGNSVSSTSFCKLKKLEVLLCYKLESVIPVSMLNRLHNLEHLTISACTRLRNAFPPCIARDLIRVREIFISFCGMMREIIGGGDQQNQKEITDYGDHDIIMFPQLSQLHLNHLEKLTSFWGNCKVAFPSLNELIIEDLEITDIWGEHNSYNNIVSSSSFCKLKWLKVKKCSKLESVIPISMLDRLQNLEYLDIEECSSLRNAFPPCIARYLINLQRVSIAGCDMMREIIGGADEQKEKEITGDHDLIIVFPELTKLKLVNLKNLTTFWCYQGPECNTYTYKVQFPSLVEFELISCEVINLEAIEFCRDDSTCPLKSMFIKSENNMQLPCKWQQHLYNLERLTLTHCWWHELKSLCFPKLKKLQVSNCGRSALFTVSGFGSLQRLQTLNVSNCDLLEEIVEDVRGHGHDEMDKKTITELLQLDSVVFKDLPNLKSFTQGANYECYMPALKKMEFDNCGLSSLFTCSVFRNLQQLHQLVVSNCRLLEAVVEDGRGDGETSDTNDKVIIHSNLFSVTLEDLPHLSSFSCSESYAFNMSGLKEIDLLKCPQLENLNEIKASTEIVSVHTEHGDEKVTDLNDFITKHRKRGSKLVALLENQVTNQELETD